MTRTNPRSPFEPPRERGTWRAFALALVMHVLLGLFLYHGIHWQNSTPEGAEAELWTEVPDMSTPRPLPPPAPVTPAPPAPPLQNEDADIALQQQKRKQEEAAREAQLEAQQRLKLQQEQEAQAKQQQELAAQQAAELAAQQKAVKLKHQQLQQQQAAAAEKLRQQQLAEQQKQQQLQQQKEQQQKQAQQDAQQKADAQKAAKAKAEAQAKAQAEAQAKKLDQERRARIAQMQGLANGGGDAASGNGLAKSGTGSGAGGTAATAGYAEKVQRRVRPNIIWGGATQGLETVVAVHCAPDGALLSSEITHSSGNAQWDQAALRAVRASDPMPLDTNGKAPATFTITLRPAAG